MSPTDIQMCVADCLLDDDVESLELVLRGLNEDDSASWRAARGQSFSIEEVQSAMLALIRSGLVTAHTEKPPTYELQPVHLADIGIGVPWASLWFHLRPTGRKAYTTWWSTEGQQKYPRL